MREISGMTTVALLLRRLSGGRARRRRGGRRNRSRRRRRCDRSLSRRSAFGCRRRRGNGRCRRWRCGRRRRNRRLARPRRRHRLGRCPRRLHRGLVDCRSRLGVEALGEQTPALVERRADLGQTGLPGRLQHEQPACAHGVESLALERSALSRRTLVRTDVRDLPGRKRLGQRPGARRAGSQQHGCPSAQDGFWHASLLPWLASPHHATNRRAPHGPLRRSGPPLHHDMRPRRS